MTTPAGMPAVAPIQILRDVQLRAEAAIEPDAPHTGEVSKTIVANPRHMPLHPMSPKLVKREHNVWSFETDGRARRFSYREAARLQGFPAGLVFPDTAAGSLDMRYKVVGNAVPPPLFEAVARALPNVWT